MRYSSRNKIIEIGKRFVVPGFWEGEKWGRDYNYKE